MMAILMFSVAMYAAEKPVSAPSYGILKGRVLDNQRHPLPGASVKIENSKLGTVTDAEGEFIFNKVSVGNHTLNITYLGFIPVNMAITVVQTGTNVEVVMIENVDELHEVVVTGVFSNQQKAINSQKNNVNITNIVSADQIGKFPDSNIGDALKRISGINVQYDRERLGSDKSVVLLLSSVRSLSMVRVSRRLKATSETCSLTSYLRIWCRP